MYRLFRNNIIEIIMCFFMGIFGNIHFMYRYIKKAFLKTGFFKLKILVIFVCYRYEISNFCFCFLLLYTTIIITTIIITNCIMFGTSIACQNKSNKHSELKNLGILCDFEFSWTEFQAEYMQWCVIGQRKIKTCQYIVL